MKEKKIEKIIYRYLQELRWWCIIRKQIQSTSNDIRSSSPTIIINRVFSFLEDFNGGKSTNLQDNFKPSPQINLNLYGRNYLLV